MSFLLRPPTNVSHKESYEQKTEYCPNFIVECRKNRHRVLMLMESAVVDHS